MKKMNVKTNADVRQLAHYIVYSLQRPDYHPDDHFGVAAI